MTSRHVGVAIAALLGAGLGVVPASAQTAQPAPRFERSVEVGAAGWVKVPLDAATRGKMRPDGADVFVRDPAGRVVPHWLVAGDASPPPAIIPGQLTDVVETPEGWLVTIDLGTDPPEHQRLRFEFVTRGVVPRVRLEASPDNRNWHEIATANLFRLGESAGVQGTEITYPNETARYLRLAWPREAGVPDLRAVSVTPAPTAAQSKLTVPLGLEPLDSSTGHSSYRLTLPGPGLVPEGLNLTWSGTGPTGYRLQRPVNGTWQTASEGVLYAGAEQSFPLPADPATGPPSAELRLELSPSERDAAPVLDHATAYAPQPWLLFQAPTGGQYSLAYGGGGVDVTAGAPPPAALSHAPEAQLGAETSLPVTPLPESSTGPGATVDVAAFRQAWSIHANGAQPGDLVRVELPDAVYEQAREDLSDIRLVTGDRQVPFVRQEVAEPAELARVASQSAPNAAPNTTRLVLTGQSSDPAEPSRPISQIELTAPAAPFSRPYSAAFQVPSESVTAADVSVPIDSGVWTCPGASVQPCRLTLLPASSPSKTIVVDIENGDNAALPNVTARMWRRSNALVFAWPGTDVQLLAGNDTLGPPHYDLTALAEDVLTRPTTAASVAAPAAVVPTPESAPPPNLPWLLLVALVVAALVLLAVLARVLRPPGGDDATG